MTLYRDAVVCQCRREERLPAFISHQQKVFQARKNLLATNSVTDKPLTDALSHQVNSGISIPAKHAITHHKQEVHTVIISDNCKAAL